MDIIESLKEQLALAHDQLGSRKNEIDALKIRVEALEQALKVAGISIEALKEQGK
jgi:hypothetical protein